MTGSTGWLRDQLSSQHSYSLSSRCLARSRSSHSSPPHWQEAILGFMRYNSTRFYIHGRFGSQFIGFMLSALALSGLQKASMMIAVAIPVLCFGLPILDVVLAVMRRFLEVSPCFLPTANTFHHRLASSQGLSQRQAVSILYATSAGFGLLSLASTR